MRVLIDTNILLDVLARRETFFATSFKIFELCQQEKITGAVAAHSITNIVYILRKSFSLVEVREMLKRLCKIFYVEDLNLEKISAAIDDEDFSDFEDCLQVRCAEHFQADYIITRDLKDFRASEILAITPENFLQLFEQDNASEE